MEETDKLLFLSKLYNTWPWYYDTDNIIKLQQNIIRSQHKALSKIKSQKDLLQKNQQKTNILKKNSNHKESIINLALFTLYHVI